ncbi:AraC family transcriptional regulator [Solimonas flava]|uniref:AraC family transcriptional regulator n=1 Tax=Solimonas flava TaxID=415849 RepID=UPI0004080132|nr:helix-turn-helix transcriptional regulator [Solimonas flava]
MTSRFGHADAGRPHYHRYDRGAAPVVAMAVDYAPGHATPPHQHPQAQLLHAVHGVMVVSSRHGQWIVPPTRGIWIPAGTEHAVRMVGVVHMRTAFIRSDAAPGLPTECAVIGISPLLRELIIAALDIAPAYVDDSRDGRVMKLLLDELRTLPTLPLYLPEPDDARLQPICATLAQSPDDPRTAAQWSQALGIDPRTLHRRFVRATGMGYTQWRQQARLLQALERLASGERVLDVALSLGYGSPSAFATMFKRQFGITPSAFFEAPDQTPGQRPGGRRRARQARA